MSSTIEQVQTLLRSIRVADADEGTLTTTAAGLRSCQRLIDSVLVSIAQRATDLHEHGHAGSPHEVLGASGYVSSATAAKEAARGEIARQIPQLGKALDNGTISGEHLDLVARHTKGLSEEQRTHLDISQLAAAASTSSPDEFNRTARGIIDKAKNDWGLGRAIEDRKRSEIKTWYDKTTGMGRLSAWLDPERFSQLRAALDAECTALANDRKADGGIVKKDEHLAADAFVSLIERGATNATGIARPLVHIHCDIDTASTGPHERSVSETSEGSHLPPESLQRLLCDSVTQAVVFDSSGKAIDVGRRSRTATDKQWAALRSTYRTCAWHGCERPIDHCQAHHIQFWEHDGPTDLDNLVPLCSHHHHRVHDLRWQLKLLPDRQLKIFKPDGEYWRTATPDRPSGIPRRPD